MPDPTDVRQANASCDCINADNYAVLQWRLASLRYHWPKMKRGGGGSLARRLKLIRIKDKIHFSKSVIHIRMVRNRFATTKVA